MTIGLDISKWLKEPSLPVSKVLHLHQSPLSCSCCPPPNTVRIKALSNRALFASVYCVPLSRTVPSWQMKLMKTSLGTLRSRQGWTVCSQPLVVTDKRKKMVPCQPNSPPKELSLKSEGYIHSPECTFLWTERLCPLCSPATHGSCFNLHVRQVTEPLPEWSHQAFPSWHL